MKKWILSFCAMPLIAVCLAGCIPLIIGGAVGALGGYAISKDTIQADTDKPYDSLWDAAETLAKLRGSVKKTNPVSGYLELQIEASKVYMRLIRMTPTVTRIRISARKYHLPNLDLAQDLFVKLMESVK